MTEIKLTDRNGRTYGGTKWGEGVTHATKGGGDECSPGWLHYYYGIYDALIMNLIHGGFQDPLAWECEAGGKIKKWPDLKYGCTRLTTLHRVELPVITIEQRVEIAIRVALLTDPPAKWREWAEKWLSGENRSEAAAAEAAAAEAAAAEAAAWAARAGTWSALVAAEAAAAAVARAAVHGVPAHAIRAVIRQVVAPATNKKGAI